MPKGLIRTKHAINKIEVNIPDALYVNWMLITEAVKIIVRNNRVVDQLVG
jgi:hypothetical protein